MHHVLEILGLVAYIACVIAGAAAITALVVRISPTRGVTAQRPKP